MHTVLPRPCALCFPVMLFLIFTQFPLGSVVLYTKKNILNFFAEFSYELISAWCLRSPGLVRQWIYPAPPPPMVPVFWNFGNATRWTICFWEGDYCDGSMAHPQYMTLVRNSGLSMIVARFLVEVQKWACISSIRMKCGTYIEHTCGFIPNLPVRIRRMDFWLTFNDVARACTDWWLSSSMDVATVLIFITMHIVFSFPSDSLNSVHSLPCRNVSHQLLINNIPKTSFLNASCSNKIISTVFFFKCMQNLIAEGCSTDTLKLLLKMGTHCLVTD